MPYGRQVNKSAQEKETAEGGESRAVQDIPRRERDLGIGRKASDKVATLPCGVSRRRKAREPLNAKRRGSSRTNESQKKDDS